MLIIVLLAAGVMLPASASAESKPGGLPEPDKFGQVELYSTASPGEVLTDSYSYSDKWFTLDPAVENKGLALLSMQLVSAAVDTDADGLGGDMLGKLGFDDIGFFGDSDLDVRDCNYTYGARRLDDGSMLVAVAIQSYAFDRNGKIKGWPQNFEVNGDTAEGEHYALNKAAEAVIPDIIKLAGDGDVRYWITGQSRGGALAGLLAAKLPDVLGSRNKGIYAYTFESPCVVQPKDDNERARFESDYRYIHNYVCTDDLVTIIPPWGMVRYGVDHILNTEEADSRLQEELGKLGSSQKVPEGYNREAAQKKAEAVLDALLKGIPTREEYSRDHSVTVKLSDGTEKAITYNYQSLLGILLVSVFGGALDEADLSNALEYLSEAMSVLTDYVSAYLAENGMIEVEEDPDALYRKAASEFNAFLKDKVSVDLKLTDDDMYALLKLAAPVIINKDAGEATGLDPKTAVVVVPLVYVASALEVPDMLFSHHFDSLLARLHVQSPAPAAGDIALTADAPLVQDPMTRMPRKIRASVAASDYGSWLTSSAEWLSEDGTIANRKVYYLKVRLSAAGHALTEDQKITLNGEEPIEKTISYEKGAYVADCVWKYTFGVPKKYRLSFEMRDHGEQIDPVDIENGTILKYSEKPADPAAKGYRFDGWYDEADDPWDEVTVSRNLYVEARWIRQVDKVNLTFRTPRVGQKIAYPTVPGGALYGLEGISFMDSDYNTVTTAKNRKTLRMSFNIRLLAYDAEFPYRIGEYDQEVYTGNVYINGKKIKVSYDEGYLRGEYEFKPLPAMPKLSKASITVKKGSTKTVKIIGKDKSIKNQYKNTKTAKVTSKKTASTIRIKGLKKGKTTLKIKANGVWLKLKVTVK